MKKTVDNFQPAGGMHCITNAMKQIFNFYGHPLSEEMLFGLGEGLDFAYINMAHSPMVSGRSKIMEFEGILSKRLGGGMKFRKGRDNNKSFEAARKMIDGNQPVLIYADMPYLPYMSLDPDSHFGGHAVVLFGYDDEQGCFYVSDRDNPDFPVRTPGGMIAENYHMVSYEQMELARSSAFRPFPANNKYIMFDFSNFKNADNAGIRQAIMAVCDKMLNPQARLKGICGIEKFGKEIIKWGSFDVAKLRTAAITNYFQISADGGTGGGIFRKMYGGFLLEAAELLDNSHIRTIGSRFFEIAEEWDIVADELWEVSEDGHSSLLLHISEEIRALHDAEYDLYSQLTKL